MAKSNTEKASFGIIDKLLFYVTPIVFLLVLLGVLLTLFNFNVMNVVLQAGQQVPIVKQILPKPSASSAQASKPNTQAEDIALQKQEISKLSQQIQQKTQDLQKLNQENQTQAQKIKDLQTQIAGLNTKLQKKTLSDQQYQQHIQNLANMYAQMIPSKSAKIMGNLTLKENALLLSQMPQTSQINILQNLDPKVAAQLTILLKDQTPVKDQEIAALQDRVNTLLTAQSPKVSVSDLANTISGMNANTAASLLIALDSTNDSQVIQILQNMSTSTRSSILSAMTQTSKDLAAKLTAKLVQKQ